MIRWAVLGAGIQIYKFIFFDSLYAVTLKKKRIVAFFSAITLTQFLMGMYMVGITVQKPGMRLIDWLPPLRMLSILSFQNAEDTTRSVQVVHIHQESSYRTGIYVAIPVLR